MKKNYYLIARNKKNNELSIIPIRSKKGCCLEEIDYYTTAFENKEALSRELLRKGLIGSKEVDIFIASQSKQNGQTNLNEQEVIYNNQKIRKIAYDRLTNNTKTQQEEFDQILDHFAYLMRSNKIFWDKVVSGKTNIYPKYAKYFTMSKIENPQRIKFLEGGWGRTSYQLIRNIIEAETRQDKNYEDIENEMYRKIANPNLKRITSPNYDENQLSMFDGIMKKEKTQEEKLVEVLNIFDNLPRHTFLINQDNKKASLNTNKLITFEENDLRILQTKLPERMRYLLQILAFHRENYQENNDYFNTSYQVPIKMAHKKLIEMLSDKKILDDAYEWCRVYLKYKEKSMGDKSAIQYKKS